MVEPNLGQRVSSQADTLRQNRFLNFGLARSLAVDYASCLRLLNCPLTSEGTAESTEALGTVLIGNPSGAWSVWTSGGPTHSRCDRTRMATIPVV